MAESRFVYVTYIRTTPEKLWQALIDPEFTRRYWCETWQDCEWKPGASWRMMIPDGRVADSGEVARNRAAPAARPDVAQRIQTRTARGRLFAADLRAGTAGRVGQAHGHPRDRQARLEVDPGRLQRLAAHPVQPQEPARNRRVARRNPPLAQGDVKGWSPPVRRNVHSR